MPDAYAPFTGFSAKVADGLGVGLDDALCDGEGEGLATAADGLPPQAATSSAAAPITPASARLNCASS